MPSSPMVISHSQSQSRRGFAGLAGPLDTTAGGDGDGRGRVGAEGSGAAEDGTSSVGNSRSGRGRRRAAVKHGVQASVARLARDRSNDSYNDSVNGRGGGGGGGSWLGSRGGGSLSSCAGSSSDSDSEDSEEEQMRAGGGGGGRRGRGGDLSGRGKEVRAGETRNSSVTSTLLPTNLTITEQPPAITAFS